MNNKKVRVLNIIGRRPTGGIGSVVYNYQNNFTDTNLEFDYMLFTEGNDGDFDKKVKYLGSKIYIMPSLKYFNIIKIFKEVSDFFKKKGKHYDIIHLHSINIGFICYPIAKKNGIKNLIAHSHSVVYSNNKFNSIRNRILCIPLKKWANKYFACSKDAGKFLFGETAIENKEVYIMNNAIDCEDFKYNEKIRLDVRKSLRINDELLIGNVGRFSKEKNHEFLIDIFLEIKRKKNNSKLLLVGDGETISKIKDKVTLNGIEDSVIFLGRRNDISSILQAIDIFISTSLFEGFGISLIEAQCSGLLTISSDIVPDEVKVTDNIYTYSLNDTPKLWADRIIFEYNNFYRKDQSDKIKQHGFDIKEEATKLQEYYNSLL